jgi:putative addiction module component (TIGR02574 family)
MTHETADIVEAALSMPASDRAELAEKLLESLGDAVDRKEIDKAWAEEAVARLRAYDEGKMKGAPLDDVLRRLKEGSAP